MKIETSQDIGNYIKKARKSVGLTQADVAASCGVGLRFYREVEKGKTTAQLGKILLILHVLKTKIDLHCPFVEDEYYDV